MTHVECTLKYMLKLNMRLALDCFRGGFNAPINRNKGPSHLFSQEQLQRAIHNVWGLEQTAALIGGGIEIVLVLLSVCELW